MIAAGGGGFGGKPRPYVVIQSEDYRSTTIILAGCHTLDGDRSTIRPIVYPTDLNGLRKVSEVTVDTLVTMRIDKIDTVVGCLAAPDMDAVDAALLLILGLAGTER